MNSIAHVEAKCSTSWWGESFGSTMIQVTTTSTKTATNVSMHLLVEDSRIVSLPKERHIPHGTHLLSQTTYC